MKTVPIKFILPVLIGILAISCEETDSDDLNENTPISQYYAVKYFKYKTETKASAYFKVRNNGSHVKLTGNSFVKFNGEQEYVYDGIFSEYKWKSNNKTDVSFTYHKNDKHEYINTVHKEDIKSIAIPGTIQEIDRKKDLEITWVGNIIGDDEAVTLRISQINDKKEAVSTAEYVSKKGTNKISLPADNLKRFTAGKVSVELIRSRTYPLRSQDLNAGGQIEVFFEDMKKIAIK